MDVIVLVGGHGTRLRPLTLHRHKSLVPLCNRPAIAYLFEWLQRSGFKRAILAIGQSNEDLARAYPSGTAHGLELGSDEFVKKVRKMLSGRGGHEEVPVLGRLGRGVDLAELVGRAAERLGADRSG